MFRGYFTSVILILLTPIRFHLVRVQRNVLLFDSTAATVFIYHVST